MISSTPNIKYCNLYWHFWYLFADYFSSKHFLGRSFQFALKLFQLNVTVLPPTIVAHNKVLFVIWYMREALSWYKTYLIATFSCLFHCCLLRTLKKWLVDYYTKQIFSPVGLFLPTCYNAIYCCCRSPNNAIKLSNCKHPPIFSY